MRRDRLRVATARDLRRISATLVETGLFADDEELARFVREGAWRVQVGEGGVVVVLEPWRTHLDLLACRAIWSPTSGVPHERRWTVPCRTGAGTRRPVPASGGMWPRAVPGFNSAAIFVPEGVCC